MEITLRDGASQRLLSLSDWTMRAKTLSQHAMRFHIYHSPTNTATRQFVTDDEKLKKRIVKYASGHIGEPFRTCSWIDVKNRTLELRDVRNFGGMDLFEMAERDLRTYWGDKAEITGMAVRDIMYVSDGYPQNTPDMIGEHRGKPLVFKGKAVGTIFKIGHYDPLASGACIAYWMPSKWWHKFHTGYKKLPREFPWPCGFVCSNWCQRTGHEGYNDGIRIASMTQGQTLGSWSYSQMTRHSDNRSLINLVGGKVLSKEDFSGGNSQTEKFRMCLAMAAASANTKYGIVGTVCRHCRAALTVPYGICIECGYSNSYGDLFAGTWCTSCGLPIDSCKCDDKNPLSISYSGHSNQYKELHYRYKKLKYKLAI